jgi:hypothetical protein
MEYCGRDGLGCGMGTQRSGVHAENGGAGRPSRGWVPELRQAREPKYGGGAARLRRGRAAMSRATAATAASVSGGNGGSQHRPSYGQCHRSIMASRNAVGQGSSTAGAERARWRRGALFVRRGSVWVGLGRRRRHERMRGRTARGRRGRGATRRTNVAGPRGLVVRVAAADHVGSNTADRCPLESQIHGSRLR